MKLDDISFRDVYHKICFISAGKNFKALTQNLPNRDNANGTLAYGYIDHEAGLTFEILSSATMSEDGSINPYKCDNKTSIKYRYGSGSGSNIYILQDTAVLTEQYQEKIDMVNKGYQCSESVEVIRSIEAIDDSRSREYPDDVMVILLRGNNHPEGCWVRCEGVKENQIVGRLLNEPDQEFGVHSGDMISFGIVKTENKILCISRL